MRPTSCHFFNLGQWDSIFLIGYVLHCWDREGSSEAIVRLASNCESHVINVNLSLSSILFVNIGLLQQLSGIIVHEFQKLISHILLIVLNPYTYTPLLNHNILINVYLVFQGVSLLLEPIEALLLPFAYESHGDLPNASFSPIHSVPMTILLSGLDHSLI